MAQNKEETINNKIELSISNENNNQISEENNPLNIINKGSNDYIKLNNIIEGKKVNLMKRIEYIDNFFCCLYSQQYYYWKYKHG